MPRPLPKIAAVTMDAAALRRAVESLPPTKLGQPGFQWTDELDQILLDFWTTRRQEDVCRLIGVTQNTARTRYRSLTGGRLSARSEG